MFILLEFDSKFLVQIRIERQKTESVIQSIDVPGYTHKAEKPGSCRTVSSKLFLTCHLEDGL
jgi:hypothetical protein